MERDGYKGESKQHNPQAGGEGSGFFLPRSIHCPVCRLPPYPGAPPLPPESCSFTGLSGLARAGLGRPRVLAVILQRLLRACHRLGVGGGTGVALLPVVLNKGNPEVFTCKVVCASPPLHIHTPTEHPPKPELLLCTAQQFNSIDRSSFSTFRRNANIPDEGWRKLHQRQAGPSAEFVIKYQGKTRGRGSLSS